MAVHRKDSPKAKVSVVRLAMELEPEVVVDLVVDLVTEMDSVVEMD